MSGNAVTINGLAVNAYDAARNTFYPATARLHGGGLELEPLPVGGQRPGWYLSPGWIDMHTHIFDGFGIFGTNADGIGWRTGVCMTVDAGTVGDFTLEGFRRYVAPTIRTNFRLFLCISPIGVIFHHEYNVMEYLDPERTAENIRQNRDMICGVKVRIGAEVIRHEGVEPLKLAAQAARMAEVPLMVHIGQNPPTIDDVEPFLQKGDILTHCFNSRGGDGWNPDGTAAPAMARMLERGVLLDVGHGGGSFSFDVCERAMRHPLPKFMIGTDLHAQSRRHSVFDMGTTLSKILGLGISLEDIMMGVTTLPSAVLGLRDWCGLSLMRNATLFQVLDEPGDYVDSDGAIRRFTKRIKPCGVVLNNEFIECGTG